jgi:hypothetical protein
MVYKMLDILGEHCCHRMDAGLERSKNLRFVQEELTKEKRKEVCVRIATKIKVSYTPCV